MNGKTRHWTAHAWIACLAVLFNAFVPLVSHALSLSSPASAPMQMEVCTAMGMAMLPTAAPDQPDKSASGKLAGSMTHCGYCAIHGAALGLPPPSAIAFAAPLGRNAFPPLYYLAPRPLFPWSLAQPRAPPVLA
jgi:hypothetical protein